jgi:hypothetical protein
MSFSFEQPEALIKPLPEGYCLGDVGSPSTVPGLVVLQF